MQYIRTCAVLSIPRVASVTGAHIAAIDVLTGSIEVTGIIQTLVNVYVPWKAKVYSKTASLHMGGMYVCTYIHAAYTYMYV